eukprot:80741-Pleurochrysis_carterae.AAC.2
MDLPIRCSANSAKSDARLRSLRALEQVTHCAPVAVLAVVHVAHELKDGSERRERALHAVGNLHELVGRVVLKLDSGDEARLDPRVGGAEPLHLVGVAREDDDEVVPVVLGQLDERVERLLAKGVALVGDDGVGLVDEEDAAQGRLDDLGIRGGGG